MDRAALRGRTPAHSTLLFVWPAWPRALAQSGAHADMQHPHATAGAAAAVSGQLHVLSVLTLAACCHTTRSPPGAAVRKLPRATAVHQLLLHRQHHAAPHQRPYTHLACPPACRCRMKMDGPYDSKVLPVLLSCTMVAALVVVFTGAVVRLQGGGGSSDTPPPVPPSASAAPMQAAAKMAKSVLSS